MNIRRDKFKDVRIREAIGLAFDFEWTNANIMYGFFSRTTSFFQNSPMAAQGSPAPRSARCSNLIAKSSIPACLARSMSRQCPMVRARIERFCAKRRNSSLRPDANALIRP